VAQRPLATPRREVDFAATLLERQAESVVLANDFDGYDVRRLGLRA
jgi:hypothetical protein